MVYVIDVRMYKEEDRGEDEEEEEDEEEAEKKKKKGKGKERDPSEWLIVGGARRCKACILENTECSINLGAIGKWREDVWKGLSFSKHPSGMNCHLCGM